MLFEMKCLSIISRDLTYKVYIQNALVFPTTRVHGFSLPRLKGKMILENHCHFPQAVLVNDFDDTSLQSLKWIVHQILPEDFYPIINLL